MLKIRPEQIESLRTRLQAETPRRIRKELLAQNVAVVTDAAASELRVADGRGFVTRLHFDESGLPDRLALPSRREQGFEYDGQGRLAAIVYPGGQRVEMHHDDEDNLVRLSRPGLLSYRFGYDPAARLTAVIDPYARRTQLEYSAKGALSSLTDRSGAKTTWERDAQGKLLAVRDPLDNRVVYETDEAGRLGAIEFPDGSREEYGFYEEENIVEVVNRDGRSVLTYLDEQGLPEEIAWDDGGWLLPVFGEQDHLVSLQNESAEIQFSYAAAGSVEEETSEAGVVRYGYDADGRLTEIETPWGDTIRYNYDEDGRLTSVTDWDERIIALEHAPDGTLAKIHRPNGLTETHRYARVGRLEQAEVTNAAGRILSRQVYNYDLCEQLTGIDDRWGDAPEERQSRQLEYDPEGRLLRELGVAGAPLAVHTYDAKGNLTACNRRPILVGKMDEPLQVDGLPLGYDAAGNMTRLPNGAGERLHCRFAANGTLQEIESQGRTWRYAYDGLSRRILKTDGESTWRYGWAGHQLLWEEVQETPDAEPMRRDYLWLPGSVTPLAFRENGQTYWLQSDARDAVIRAFDASGEVVWSARYASFGEVHLRTQQVRQPWRLAGQYADDETGLYYNFARYYSPHLKSYLSRDPQWRQYGASNYSYCLNDPWNRADPFGAKSRKLTAPGTIAVNADVAENVESIATASGKLLQKLENLGLSNYNAKSKKQRTEIAAFLTDIARRKADPNVCVRCILIKMAGNLMGHGQKAGAGDLVEKWMARIQVLRSEHLGEVGMETVRKSLGYKPVLTPDQASPRAQGFDGVYEDKDGYVVVGEAKGGYVGKKLDEILGEGNGYRQGTIKHTVEAAIKIQQYAIRKKAEFKSKVGDGRMKQSEMDALLKPILLERDAANRVLKAFKAKKLRVEVFHTEPGKPPTTRQYVLEELVEHRGNTKMKVVQTDYVNGGALATLRPTIQSLTPPERPRRRSNRT